MYKEMLGAKLKEARKKAGYTQQEVEIHTDISRQVLSHYETGKREPNIETLAKLSDFYEVSIDWLVGTMGKNKKNEKK